MIAAMSPSKVGSPVSQRPAQLSLSADFDLADCELTPDELSRLFGEIDSLQLNSLLAPFWSGDRGFKMDQAS